MSPSGTAIEVRDLQKSFRVPKHRVETLKERALHPRRGSEHTTLRVLDGISFDVRRGEFFAICGRNGSGKSTLLKLLSSVYRIEGGNIRIAGNVAAIIELGVGFRPELPAAENAILNGMVMGLSASQVRERLHDIIAFAELEDFTELQLKNYSSGMRARLAFAIMAHSDADVMLIDEVFAVGDARFQRRCEQAMERFTREGRTIVLVTHHVSRLKNLCDRALLLEDGRIEAIGGPAEIAQRYNELNLERAKHRGQSGWHARLAGPEGATWSARLGELQIGDTSTEPGLPRLNESEPLRIRALVVALEALDAPAFGFEIRDARNTLVFSPPAELLATEAGRLEPGDRMLVEANVENRLLPGTYEFSCFVSQRSNGDRTPASLMRSESFEVAGKPGVRGAVGLKHQVRSQSLATGGRVLPLSSDLEAGR